MVCILNPQGNRHLLILYRLDAMSGLLLQHIGLTQATHTHTLLLLENDNN